MSSSYSSASSTFSPYGPISAHIDIYPEAVPEASFSPSAVSNPQVTPTSAAASVAAASTSAATATASANVNSSGNINAGGSSVFIFSGAELPENRIQQRIRPTSMSALPSPRLGLGGGGWSVAGSERGTMVNSAGPSRLTVVTSNDGSTSTTTTATGTGSTTTSTTTTPSGSGSSSSIFVHTTIPRYPNQYNTNLNSNSNNNNNNNNNNETGGYDAVTHGSIYPSYVNNLYPRLHNIRTRFPWSQPSLSPSQPLSGGGPSSSPQSQSPSSSVATAGTSSSTASTTAPQQYSNNWGQYPELPPTRRPEPGHGGGESSLSGYSHGYQGGRRAGNGGGNGNSNNNATGNNTPTHATGSTTTSIPPSTAAPAILNIVPETSTTPIFTPMNIPFLSSTQPDYLGMQLNHHEQQQNQQRGMDVSSIISSSGGGNNNATNNNNNTTTMSSRGFSYSSGAAAQRYGVQNYASAGSSSTPTQQQQHPQHPQASEFGPYSSQASSAAVQNTGTNTSTASSSNTIATPQTPTATGSTSYSSGGGGGGGGSVNTTNNAGTGNYRNYQQMEGYYPGSSSSNTFGTDEPFTPGFGSSNGGGGGGGGGGVVRSSSTAGNSNSTSRASTSISIGPQQPQQQRTSTTATTTNNAGYRPHPYFPHPHPQIVQAGGGASGGNVMRCPAMRGQQQQQLQRQQSQSQQSQPQLPHHPMVPVNSPWFGGAAYGMRPPPGYTPPPIPTAAPGVGQHLRTMSPLESLENSLDPFSSAIRVTTNVQRTGSNATTRISTSTRHGGVAHTHPPQSRLSQTSRRLAEDASLLLELVSKGPADPEETKEFVRQAWENIVRLKVELGLRPGFGDDDDDGGGDGESEGGEHVSDFDDDRADWGGHFGSGGGWVGPVGGGGGGGGVGEKLLAKPRVVSREKAETGTMIDAACSVCLTAVADTVVLPCNHLVLCSSCCDLMGIVEKRSLGYPCPRHMPQQVPCPICRVTVQDRIKVFRG